MARPIVNIKFLADLKQFSTQMQNASRDIGKLSNKMSSVGKSLSLGLTAPIVGLGVAATKTFADFEQEMAKVLAISGATTDQFKALNDSAKTLGATTRFTASEVAGLQLNFSKLGFRPDEILNATSATLDLALATGEDLAQSAVVAASTLRGFQLDASETGRVVDVMAKSFSSSALDLSKFETAMAILAPVANSAGVSLEQATGLLSVLVNAGIDASTAGTGLRNIFLDLAESGQSFGGAMEQINNSTNQNATALGLFGKRGATVATVLAQNVEQAALFAGEFTNAGGAAKEMAAIMDNTLQGTFFRLRSAIEGVAIEFGEALKPALTVIADTFGELANYIRDLSPETKKFVVILAGVGAAIGPLLVLAGTILPAIATGFAILTGPIGAIVAGLTAIGVIIYKNWQPIKRTLIQVANYFIDLYNESLAFRIIVESVSTAFKNLFRIGKFVITTIGQLFRLMGEQIKTGFSNLGDIIKAIFTGNFQDIPLLLAKSFSDGLDNVKEFARNSAKEFEVLKEDIRGNIQQGIDAALNGRKIRIDPDSVDADAVQNKVASAVQKGAQGIPIGGSGSGGGRARNPGSKLVIPTIGTVGTGPEAGSSAGLTRFLTDAEVGLVEFQIRLQEFQAQSAEILQGVSENFAQGFADVVAGIATGAAGFGAVGGLLLNTLADLAQQLGKAAIKIGLTMKAVKLSFKSPLAAVAAGTGLLVVAGLLRSLAGRFGGGGGGSQVPGFANGGIVGGSSFYGDKILARLNSGELILNKAQQRNLYGMMQTSRPQINLQPSIEYDGRYFRIALNDVDDYLNRIS